MDRSVGPGRSNVSLEHWLFGSGPETGYGVQARSPGLNLSMYERLLEGIYAPLAGATLHGDAGPVDALMAHSANAATELLLSLISDGPPDAFGRKTFQSHTAVLPIELLQQGRLVLSDVEQALRSFNPASVGPSGILDPIVVPRNDRPDAEAQLGVGIGRFISRASVETLLTRLIQDPGARTLVLCRDSSQSDRRLTLLKIIEVLSFVCNLPIVSSLSDQPAGGVLNRFQLVVAARAFRADNSWVLLENALEIPALPRIPADAQRYLAMERCFRTTAAPS